MSERKELAQECVGDTSRFSYLPSNGVFVKFALSELDLLFGGKKN